MLPPIVSDLEIPRIPTTFLQPQPQIGAICDTASHRQGYTGDRRRTSPMNKIDNVG
jgi:hypothetical protein